MAKTEQLLVLYLTGKFILFLKSKYTRLESVESKQPGPNVLLPGKLSEHAVRSRKKEAKQNSSTQQMAFLNNCYHNDPSPSRAAIMLDLWEWAEGGESPFNRDKQAS